VPFVALGIICLSLQNATLLALNAFPHAGVSNSISPRGVLFAEITVCAVIADAIIFHILGTMNSYIASLWTLTFRHRRIERIQVFDKFFRLFHTKLESQHAICAQDVWNLRAWQHASFLASRILFSVYSLMAQE